jgi:hypothetical protein
MGIEFPVILQFSDKGDNVSTHLPRIGQRRSVFKLGYCERWLFVQ